MAALQMMFLKYQLPSEPNVYVDLLDDEDVSLMFDEVCIAPPHHTCLLHEPNDGRSATTCGEGYSEGPLREVA